MQILPCDDNDEILNRIIRMVSVMEHGLYLDEKYKLVCDGEERYLLIEKNCFMIVNIEDNSFSSLDVFAVDEYGHIVLMMFHNSNLAINNGQVYMFDNKYLEKGFEDDDEYDDLRAAFEYYQDDNEYPLLNSLSLLEIEPVQKKYAHYNALLLYIQSNIDTKVRLHTFSFYNSKFDGKDLINEGYFKEPNYIKLVSLAHGLSIVDDKDYYLAEWDKGMPYYDLALMKTVGLFDYLFTKFKNSFAFYYNKPVFDKDGNVLLKNLLTSGMFDMGDIDKKLYVRGLSRDVPKELIDLFNKEDDNYKLCEAILNEYVKLNEEKKLVYRSTMGDKNG